MAAPYTQTSWVEDVTKTSPANLGNMETGIFLASAPIVTSLPASPVDGQECNYLADATAGVIWHLVYRSASGKWLFTGGSEMVGRYQSQQGLTTAATQIAGLGLIAPLAGDYDITFHVAGQMDTAVGGGVDFYTAVYVAGVKVTHDFDAWDHKANQWDKWTPTDIRRITGIAAGAQVDVRVWSSQVAGNQAIYNADLRLRPVKVG
jgi:hypothetical protein